ncbi:hypothetical protein K491DRAFT_784011 [Lophiostoma macrostomum CBS 122681]|uniref:Uncharacterized protein n=1 Tax=Lophiostoma macrostomum CBS 122681 TaxID=1314788 RepID=A0A6A6SKU8_9PLEO|nr:hypothetical protein K491DRAFT_784011 [Lophiostoma macrostomum CBS 122681]
MFFRKLEGIVLVCIVEKSDVSRGALTIWQEFVPELEDVLGAGGGPGHVGLHDRFVQGEASDRIPKLDSDGIDIIPNSPSCVMHMVTCILDRDIYLHPQDSKNLLDSIVTEPLVVRHPFYAVETDPTVCTPHGIGDYKPEKKITTDVAFYYLDIFEHQANNGAFHTRIRKLLADLAHSATTTITAFAFATWHSIFGTLLLVGCMRSLVSLLSVFIIAFFAKCRSFMQFCLAAVELVHENHRRIQALESGQATLLVRVDGQDHAIRNAVNHNTSLGQRISFVRQDMSFMASGQGKLRRDITALQKKREPAHPDTTAAWLSVNRKLHGLVMEYGSAYIDLDSRLEKVEALMKKDASVGTDRSASVPASAAPKDPELDDEDLATFGGILETMAKFKAFMKKAEDADASPSPSAPALDAAKLHQQVDDNTAAVDTMRTQLDRFRALAESVRKYRPSHAQFANTYAERIQGLADDDAYGHLAEFIDFVGMDVNNLRQRVAIVAPATLPMGAGAPPVGGRYGGFAPGGYPAPPAYGGYYGPQGYGPR